MISDIFYTRYQGPIVYGGNVPPDIQVLFRQAAHIIFASSAKSVGRGR